MVPYGKPKMQGPRPGSSPDQLEKSLLGIYQASVGFRQMLCRYRTDAPVDVFCLEGHQLVIYRASTGHLLSPLDKLFKKLQYRVHALQSKVIVKCKLALLAHWAYILWIVFLIFLIFGGFF